MKPQRIQLSRAKGFRLQAASMALNGLRAAKVDRSTRWGNPYRVGEPVDVRQLRRWGWEFSPRGKLLVCVDAEEAVRRFATCLALDEAIHPFLRQELAGKNLACFCGADGPCHADPILRIANP